MKENKTFLQEMYELIDGLDMRWSDPYKVHSYVVDTLKLHAHKFHLARVEVHEVVVPNMFYPNGKERTQKSDYAPINPDESAIITFDFENVNRVACTFKFYPEAGYEWNDDEKMLVMRVSKLVSLMISRSEMLGNLSRIEYIDMMTGLTNAAGMKCIGIELSDQNKMGKYVGIWYNLKGFKYINKKYGAALGDEMIVYVGKEILKLNDSLPGENYVSRFGGDNFFLMILRDNIDTVIKTLSSFKFTREVFGKEIVVDLLGRICLYDNVDGAPIGAIINSTNFALDVARELGKDIIWFNDEMGQKIVQSKKIVMEFPLAMKSGSIVPYYQPKVTVEGGELCGAEALVRWVQGDKILPPVAFLPFIEREGSVKELDLYMLEMVCKHMREWIDKGIDPVRTSVNYSKVNLTNPNLAEQTLDILKKYDIDTSLVEIEITETIDYEDNDLLEAFMKAMREAGIKISMDDFGTGYSSLYLFKDRTFDVVKIDKSFVDNITKDLP
ncbi:MAG: EAL domain-containing protein, partial [Lachnospiraceae bacterium]|nr:EAL domain-containing protein [Lachnospiraceae bacterium]